jgi:hypothetical protein
MMLLMPYLPVLFIVLSVFDIALKGNPVMRNRTRKGYSSKLRLVSASSLCARVNV